MGDGARAGRTVVLVSHQLNQIRRLCHRVVWVDAGSVRQDGNTHEVVSAYQSAMARGDSNGHSQVRGAGPKARFLRWEISAPPGNRPPILTKIPSTTIKFPLQVAQTIPQGHTALAPYN